MKPGDRVSFAGRLGTVRASAPRGMVDVCFDDSTHRVERRSSDRLSPVARRNAGYTLKRGKKTELMRGQDVAGIVRSSGVGVLMREDPPRIAKDGRSYCGNPIDGTAYYLVVSSQRRTPTRYVTWREVLAAANAAKLPKAPDKVVDFVASTSSGRDGLVRTAVNHVFKQLSPGWRAILMDLTRVQARPEKSDGPFAIVPPGGKVAGKSEVLITIPSPKSLEKLIQFFHAVYIPRLQETRQRVYQAPVQHRSFMRMRKGAKARRGKRSRTASGGLYEEADLLGKDPELADAEGDLEYARKVQRTAELQLRMAQARNDAALRTYKSDAAEAQKKLEEAEKRVAQLERRPASKKRLKKAAPATQEAVPGISFATPVNGQVMYWKVASSEAAGENMLSQFQLFEKRTFQAVREQPLAEAIVTLSRVSGPLAPLGIAPAVADALVRSGLVAVAGTIVVEPGDLVERGESITISAPDKAGSPFFSWVSSWLPSQAIVECLSPAEREEHPGNPDWQKYKVYKTYNPVLFELTRLFWASRRGSDARWGSVLAQPKSAADIDTVGRFGATLSLLQQATLYAESEGQLEKVLLSVMSPVSGKSLPVIIRNRNRQFTPFNLMWPLGAPLLGAGGAFESVTRFLQDPAGYARELKLRVDQVAPRLLRTKQIGIPRDRLRVMPGADVSVLRRALARAVGPRGSELYADMTDEQLRRKGIDPRQRAALEVELLKRVQSAPPPIRKRTRKGRYDLEQLKAVPATGKYDLPTTRLLSKIANAPVLPPGEQEFGGQPAVPWLLRGPNPDVLPGSMLARTEAKLSTLQGMIESIDAALATLEV